MLTELDMESLPHTSTGAGGTGPYGNDGNKSFTVSFHPIDDDGKGESAVTSIGSVASYGSLVSASTSSFTNAAPTTTNKNNEGNNSSTSRDNDNFLSTFLSLGDFSSSTDGNGEAAAAAVPAFDGTAKTKDDGATSSSSSSLSSLSGFNSCTDEIDGDPSIAKGGVSTPFPWKLHIMLEAIDKEGATGVVSWLSHGKAFIVHKPRDFVSEIMPKFFNQSKYVSGLVLECECAHGWMRSCVRDCGCLFLLSYV